MKPTDLRNATWREVCAHLTEDLVRVHLAWQAYGPGTTREIAQKAGISLLTLRPRTTDLYKLGLVVLVDQEKANGIYAARTREEAEISRAWQERADFRAQSKIENPKSKIQQVGFITVEEAIASLTDSEKAALGARLMGQYGHGAKRREAAHGALQLELPTEGEPSHGEDRATGPGLLAGSIGKLNLLTA